MVKGTKQIKGFRQRVLELKSSGLSHRQIAKEVGCSKATVSFHVNNAGIGVPRRFPTDDDIKQWSDLYSEHKSIKKVAKLTGWSVVTISKYVDKTPRKIMTDVERKKSATASVGKRRKKIKKDAVAYKGGKCLICGYNRCVEAMDFHHLDPSKKEFGLSINGLSRSEERRVGKECRL